MLKEQWFRENQQVSKGVKAGFSIDEVTSANDGKTKIKKDNSVFTIKTPAEWINHSKQQPDPKMLFDQLWYEGTLVFFFSSPGTGKTILGYQIAQSVATGIPIDEKLQMTAKPQKVFYLDIELNEKQFESRFRDETKGTYHFLSDNILRADINYENIDLSNDETATIIINEIIKISKQQGIKVFIIDNISSIYDVNNYRKAIEFMQKLMRLKKQLKISMLVMGHTPKRDLREPLQMYSMQGSANLVNLIDGQFAIGESSTDVDFRYIKELKSRSNKKKFGEDNVLIMELITENGYLHFKVQDTEPEFKHLRKPDHNEDRNRQIKETYKSGKFTQMQIAEKFDLSRETVNKIINNTVQAEKDNLQF